MIPPIFYRRTLQKKGDRRFAPISPCESAGQSTEKRSRLQANFVWLDESKLTHVAVLLFVRPDCAPRLWPQDSVNGSMVITRALQPAL